MYRPADTDSSDEDDYEGFSFGGPGHDSSKPKPRSFWVADPDQELFDAVCSGNLEELIRQIDTINFDINQPVKSGLTLLHYACKNGHIEIVKYLFDKNANANRQVDSTTPLMEACCCVTDERTAKTIVKMLLERSAVVNVSDKYGMTPFMFACKNGNTEVVKLLAPLASLEAIDNQGCTALFHAIENNHPEIVKLLVNAGAKVDLANRKGYTPRQVAQFHGFYDILDLLPAEEYTYLVPTSYLSYNSFRDYIPRIFLKSETPEYFQEIRSILCGLHLERFLENFASNRVDLMHFLTITDDEMKAIGIEYPIHRGKIKIGLLNYHLNHWSKNSIARVGRQETETFYDILMLSANHMQNLVTISASLKYIQQNLKHGICGKLDEDNLEAMRQKLTEYKTAVLQLKKTTTYLSDFSPRKPPLLVNYADYKAAQRKRRRVRTLVKYSLFVGISIVICLKVKKMI